MVLRRCWWIALVILALIAVPAAAQDDANIKFIPQSSLNFFMTVSPDQRQVVTWENAHLFDSDDFTPDLTTLNVIDLETGETLAQLAGASDFASGAAFTPDGSVLATTHANGDLLLWDMTDYSLIDAYELLVLGWHSPQFLDDGSTLVVNSGGHGNNTFLFIDTQTGAIERILGRRFEQQAEFTDSLSELENQVSNNYVDYVITDDARLVAVNFNGDIRVWDGTTNEPRIIYEGTEAQTARLDIPRVQLTANNTVTFYDGTRDAIIQLDLDSGDETVLLEGGNFAFGLSPDETQIAWVGAENDGTVYTAALPDGEPQVLLESVGRPALPTTVAAFTDDGNQLIIGGLAVPSGENGIYVIDLAG